MAGGKQQFVEPEFGKLEQLFIFVLVHIFDIELQFIQFRQLQYTQFSKFKLIQLQFI
jgi:hypothetical protein